MNTELILQRIKQNALILGSLFIDIITTLISVIFFGIEEVIPIAVVLFMVTLVSKNYIILFVNLVFKGKTNKKDLEIALLKQENKYLEEIVDLRKTFEVKYKAIKKNDELLTEAIKKVEEFNGK